MEQSAEDRARHMLARIGVENAYSFSAGDLVELANLIALVDDVEAWKQLGEKILENQGGMFALGAWWADRPWRRRDES